MNYTELQLVRGTKLTKGRNEITLF